MRSHSSKQTSLPLRAAPGLASGGTAPLAMRPADSAAKRSFDILAALALLIFFGPLMSFIALALWGSGAGSVLIAEPHIGVQGRAFRRWRFHARADGTKSAARLGGFLRCSGLDCLPQLFNVLIGEMSLVGPSALAAEEAPRYGAAIVEYRNCRPGLTGLWQISGCSRRNYLHRVELDRLYARNWSFRRDLVILLRTPGGQAHSG